MVRLKDNGALLAFQGTTQLYQYMLNFGTPLHTFQVAENDDKQIKVANRRERCSAKIVPTGSDFVADVEIVVRNMQRHDYLAYFLSQYGKQTLADVYEDLGEDDAYARVIIGRAFLASELYPLHRYMQSIDVRGGRWNWRVNRVER